VLSMTTAMEVLQGGIGRRLGRGRPAGSPRAFLAVDPEAGKDDPVDAITRMKQKRLADEDQALEEKKFPSTRMDGTAVDEEFDPSKEVAQISATGVEQSHAQRAG
jgi:hypothetical protein